MSPLVSHSNARRLIPLAVLLGGLAPAGGQSTLRPAASATATLPLSNEAALLSGRADEALRHADYELAIRLVEQLLRLPDGLVAVPGSGTYRPVRYEAYRLLALFPPAGVRLYRQRYDAAVAARFQEASSAADVPALRELFRTYRLSSVWPAIAQELAAHLLDRGLYGQAVRVLRETVSASRQPGSRLRAQLVAALALSHAWRSAQRVLGQVKAQADSDAQPSWQRRVAQLEHWLAARRPAAPGPQQPAAASWQPCLAAGALWSRAFGGADDADGSDRELDLAGAVEHFRRLPLHEPKLAGDVLVVRLGGVVRAFDARWLAPLWSQPEIRAPGSAASARPDGWPGVAGQREDQGGRPEISAAARRLVRDALGQAISTGLGRVYTIEGIAAGQAEEGLFGRPRLGSSERQPARNELVARDLRSGALLWRSGAAPSGPLYGVAFQDCPVVVGERLVAPFVRGDRLSLAVLEASSGRLIREIPVVGPPTRFTPGGGRCRIAADQAMVYLCTGNGVIAAFDRPRLEWAWAAVYPSSLAEHLRRVWWQAGKPLGESGIDRPVLSDDLLVVAPVDSRQILALDRFSGRLSWRVARGQYTFLVGALADGLVVGGQGIACLSWRDGRTLLWRSVPLAITGRPAIQAGKVCVPTRAGIVIIDGTSGKLIADPSLPGGAAPRRAPAPTARLPAGAQLAAGNLLACPEGLFAVAPGRVAKFPDLRAARRSCQAALARDPSDARAGLALAWLELLAGEPAAALERLERLRAAGAALDAAGERLLGLVCVGLAQRAHEAPARLAWLRRAASAAESSDAAGQMALLVGQALEDGARWPEALEHYLDMLLQDKGGYVREAGDAQRRLAGWLHAAQRIRALLPKVSAGQAEAFLDRLVGRATAGDVPAAVLRHARLAVPDAARRARIDRALVLRHLPPELTVRHLPAIDDPALPATLRRRLLLERWDAHLALGMLEEARRDQARWQEGFGGRQAAAGVAQRPPADRQAEARRLERIRLASGKLAQAAARRFESGFRRQWLLRGAELIFDERRPGTAMRPWLLVRHLQERQIVLHSVSSGAPLRQTADVLSGDRRRGAVDWYGYRRSLYSRAESRGDRRGWPIVLDGYLGAVPLPGGLVCIGLGPERRGGQRLWEHRVPEWTRVPARFSDTAVAGPLGICFTPRRDRLVMLDWADGRLRWERDLRELDVARLERAGRTIVAVSDDRQVLSFDAASGAGLGRLPTEFGTPRAIAVSAGLLLIAGERWLVGLDPGTFAPRWKAPGAPVERLVAVPQRGWVACRRTQRPGWELRDARSGRPLAEQMLSEVADITAIASAGGVLYAAGRPAAEAGSGSAGVVLLAAIDLSSGRTLWSVAIPTTVQVNATQLAAHPEYIPLLRLEAGGESGPAADLRSLSIQLLRKATGQVLEAVAIGTHFQPADASCRVTMLATPGRMIVQAAANIVAFGNSALEPEP